MATTAAVYVRISQDRGGAGLGVDRQEKDCRALAERLGWSVGAVFIDNDVSAYSGKQRPGYLNLLAEIESGRVTAVLAWHPDRLHRSPRELETYIDLADKYKVQTNTVTAGHWDLSTPSGRANARNMGVWARFESEHKSERIKNARVRDAIDGKWHGGVRPFGFEKDGQTVRPSEAAEIVNAIEATVSGVSLRSLVRDLNTRNVETVKGNSWTAAALKDIMLSPRVAGLSTHLGEVVGKAVWPALVSEDLWRGAVAVLTDPSRRTSPGGTVRWLGSGIYRCGVCGQAKLRASTSGSKRNPAYRCAAREVGDATGHVVRDCASVDNYVEQVLVARLSEPGLIDELLHDGPVDTTETRLELLATEQRLAELADAFAAGEITRVQLARASAKLREKAGTLSAQIADASVRGPLALLSGAKDVAALWFGAKEDRSDGLGLGHRREILNALATVTIEKTTMGRRRGGAYFDPNYVRIEWKMNPAEPD